MQGIDREITRSYNLDIRSILPCKDAYLINTSKGKKVLKKTNLYPDRILFIHGAKEHLYQNDFTNLDRYICTVDGEPYVRINEECYTVTNMIEGRECNFDSRDDIIGASILLASLHKASRGYIPPENSRPQDELGKLPVYFLRRLNEIKKLKKVAEKGNNKFDYMFADHMDYFYSIGEQVIGNVKDSCYERLVNESRLEHIICHHDYTHHNIICGDNKFSITNFDFCCYELKVYDIANLIRRKMRKCNWDINEARVIIDSYRSVENISSDEFLIMKYILQFPQKFWRVANKYYNSKRSWSEKSFVVRLQEVIDEVRHHNAFMDRYDSLL